MQRNVTRWFFAILVMAVPLILPRVALANQPPHAVASAGVDINTGQVLNQVTLYIGPADTGIAFTVNGGGSSDADGDSLSFSWECADSAGNKCIFALSVPRNQVNFRPTFPAGTFDVTLTVDDGNNHTATDTVRVRVLVDLSPPTVTPPDDESISATEAGGARGAASSDLHKFLFNSATATDNSTAVFTHLPPQVNGVDVDDNTMFPHGTTTVTFRIADNFGNVGTATAEAYVTDLQAGDLFVGVQPLASGAAQRKGVVQRIRGGSVTDFCQSPEPATFAPLQIGDPVFWNRPDQIVVDSKGRVTFLAALNFGTPLQPSLQQGWGLLRCNLPGQPPEQLGIFPQAGDLSSSLPPGSYMDPGWPVPLPGRTFYGLPPTTGLHLRKTKHVLIDDNVNNGNPQIVTEEKYVLAFQDSFDGSGGGHIGSLSLNTGSLVFAEGDDAIFPVAVGLTTTGPQNLLPAMFFHSKIETVSFLGVLSFPAPVAKTYVTRFGVLRRIHQPFEVQLTANTSAGTVQFGVQVFGGTTEMPSAPITDDVQIPNAASGCNPFPPIRGDWPQRLGGYSVLQTDGVIYEKNSGLVINSGFSMPGWAGHVDEALIDLDAQNDPSSHFAMPEIGCQVVPVVNFTPLAGGASNPSGGSVADLSYDVDLTGWGFHPDRMAASPNGLFGTQAGSPFTGVTTGRVVQATGAHDLVEVATGLAAPRGLAAFPPQLGLIALSALIIRIDSPVDVVLADALGRRVGVLNGQALNEFGGQAHDTGAQTHPRLYIIQHPQPGNYSVRSTGTGTGPFTVHIYSVDSEKKVTQHISASGNAQPGSSGKHDFDLNANANIAFSNLAPTANAGADQTLNADASGNATVMLDGSTSSDPDGDALSFLWVGPSSMVSGAAVQLTLPVGIHVLTLTVDDGKGGTAKDTVTITVTGTADTTAPALTLPANITVEAAGPAGAVVSFAATAMDNVDGAVPVTCAPPSGATFALGTTTVNCSASDLIGNNANGNFNVTVQDTTAPALTLPSNITTIATSPSGAVVNFTATANDLVSGARAVNCVPSSGSTFAAGTTPVNCSASDVAGNAVSGSFNVTVNPQPPPSAGPIACGVASVTRVNPGVWSVFVRFTNTSGAPLSAVTLRSYSFATLAGSGTVAASWAFSPRPGYAVGAMADGGMTTLRWVLFVPSTVQRFSIDSKFTANGSSAQFGCSATVNMP